jgi:hypothetical protein
MADTASRLRSLPQRWRYALIGGLLALPSTAVGYLQPGAELVLSPVLLGGLLAGYLAERQTGESRGVGVRVGLVGAVPVTLVIFDVLAATSALSGPSWVVATGTFLTVGFTAAVGVLGFGLAALIGEAGGRVGGWVAKTRSGHSAPAADR